MAQLVGRLVWDQDAASSSLATRTKNPDSAYAEPGFLLCLGRDSKDQMRLSGGQSLAAGSTVTTSLFSSFREENANESRYSNQIRPIILIRKVYEWPVFSIAHEFYRLQHQNNRQKKFCNIFDFVYAIL